MYLSQSHEYRLMTAQAHADRLNRCCQHDCDSDPEQDLADGTNSLYCEWGTDHVLYINHCESHGGGPKALCAECLHVTHHTDECGQPAAIAAQERRRAAGFTIGEDH